MLEENIIKKLFTEGKDKFSDMEVYYGRNKKIEISLYEGEIDRYSISDTEGMSFRGLNKDNMGYSYTERVDESSINMLIEEAYMNSDIISSDVKENIYKGDIEYPKVKFEKNNLPYILIEEKIKLLKDMEKHALAFSNYIDRVETCIYNEIENERYIENTNGLNLTDKSGLGLIYISVVAKKNGDTKVGSSFKIGRDIADFNYKEVAEKAAREAISMLAAESIDSGDYNVILKNNVMSSLIYGFKSIFISENVQKGMSLLKGKLGNNIANKNVSIIEDPFLYKGLGSTTFDDEGVRTKYKEIISNGKLTTFLYNLKSSEVEGKSSTGNGFKNSFKSSIDFDTTNLFLEPKDESLEDLLKTLDEGLYITNVEGLHSGLNPTSGEFSLSASGYQVKSGKIYRPINQITIAGNILDLFKSISLIADDLQFELNGVGSPSILVNNISVSGK